MRFGLIAILALSFASVLKAADPAADIKLAASVKAALSQIKHEKLPNGLNIYLLPIPTSPVVTTMVAYKVGSGDEDKDQTGLSHYLEHLLFKGTDKYMPGDIDRATQRNGGMNNAYTSEDMTVYHFDFAADRWMAALEIEADRMRNVKIDAKHEFQQEKGAVIAELKRNEDSPGDLENKTILPLLYPKTAPYSHPVIGEETHVRGATAETIKRYYDKWYHPNNASLVVVGGFDPDAAMAKIKTLFGPIPKYELPARKPAPPASNRTKQERKEFESKFDTPRLLIGFNTCKMGEPDDDVLDMLSGVIGSGKTSRLYKRLVETERLAISVSAGNSTGRYPGWFPISVDVIPGKDRAKVEAIIFEELAKLTKEPITPEEFNRSRRQRVAGFVFSQESVHGMCDLIARSVTNADLPYLVNYLDRILALTPADLQKTSAKYFSKEKSCVVWSVPPMAAEGAGKPEKPAAAARKHLSKAEGAQGALGPDLTQAKTRKLANGITVITLENRRLPIFLASAHIEGVRYWETKAKAGLAKLTGDLLEEGTAKYKGEEIANIIESTGGSLSMGAGGGSLEVLTPDTTKGLELMFECLIRPTFPKESFDRLKEEQLAEIADSETQPNVKAARLFAAQIYADHPYGRPMMGNKATVTPITVEEVKAFHAKAFIPNDTTLVLVGDFDTAEIIKQIETLTADWKISPDPVPVPKSPPEATKGMTKIVPDAAASQTHVHIGHLGITRTDPDYYTLLVMDNVLGTGPGFTDRLSATLRDRQGLAYTVNARISASADIVPGTFHGYIGTFPDKFITVRDGFLREVNRIRDETPTEKEVDDAKRYLLGSMPFRLTSNASVAGELLAAHRHKLGFDYLTKFKSAIEAVTPAAVQAAAKKHLQPEKLNIIVVGPIGQDGQPLPAPNPKK